VEYGGVRVKYDGVRWSTIGVQVEYSGVRREYKWSTSGVRRSTSGVQWSTSGVQVEYSGVQVEYKWSTGGVQGEYRRSTGVPESRLFPLVGSAFSLLSKHHSLYDIQWSVLKRNTTESNILLRLKMFYFVFLSLLLELVYLNKPIIEKKRDKSESTDIEQKNSHIFMIIATNRLTSNYVQPFPYV
jgi:hypothetical protein